MKYPGTAIREAVYNLISAITSEGKVVKVYDEITAPDAGFPRILLQDVSGGGPRDSKCGFGGDWTQTIKVTTAFKNRVTKNIGEDVANEILELLVPRSGDFLSIGPDFNIWKVEGALTGTVSYSDGVRTYVDNNIRITYSLTEK